MVCGEPESLQIKPEDAISIVGSVKYRIYDIVEAATHIKMLAECRQQRLLALILATKI